MEYPVIERFSPKHTAQLHQLYLEEWWTDERTLDEVEMMLAHSDLCIGVLDPDSEDLVGFARVLTDRVFKALIFDVIVVAHCRDRQLGALLMESLLLHRDLQHVKHFELYCLPEMEPFYRRWGFSRDVSGVSLMRRSGSDIEV